MPEKGKPGPTIVGLTGGIGAGKSTASLIFAKGGVPIIDADLIAREIVEPGSEVLTRVRDRYGDKVIQKDGNLNRSELAQIVFNDANALADLNRIMHPEILSRTHTKMESLIADGFEWVIYEAALIVGSEMAPALECLVVVHAEESRRIERVVERDDVQSPDVRARISHQVNADILLEAADYVISNDGNLKDLEKESLRVFELLVERLGPLRKQGG